MQTVYLIQKITNGNTEMIWLRNKKLVDNLLVAGVLQESDEPFYCYGSGIGGDSLNPCQTLVFQDEVNLEEAGFVFHDNDEDLLKLEKEFTTDNPDFMEF